MADVFIAESATNPDIGGVIVRFPSGATKSLSWVSRETIDDTLTAAKEYTAKLVATMLADGLHADLDATNIPSLCATVQASIHAFNERKRGANAAT